MLAMVSHSEYYKLGEQKVIIIPKKFQYASVHSLYFWVSAHPFYLRDIPVWVPLYNSTRRYQRT